MQRSSFEPTIDVVIRREGLLLLVAEVLLIASGGPGG